MVTLLELLGRQRQTRVGSADDVLAAAAREHASGKSPDLAIVDAALHEIGQPIEHFGELCRVAAVRRELTAALEKLGTATTKQRRLDEALASERHKHDEYRKAYLDRMAAMEAEKAATDAIVAKAQQAREALLQPENVLGGVRRRYEEALADRQQATETVERLRSELRQHRSKIREAERWIASILQSVERTIHPVSVVITTPTLPASVVRQLEPHELAKKRNQRRIEETEPQLREAEDVLDRAERAVVAIELEILRS